MQRSHAATAHARAHYEPGHQTWSWLGGGRPVGVGQHRPQRVGGEIAQAIASVHTIGGTEGRRAAETALSHRAAIAERVSLVEEHDHPAVAQGELAKLAEQALDLEDPDAHEHVGECAGVDEHEGLAGLARHRLGHQRLAGTGRAPQQQATGNISAPLLDRLGVVEEQHVLLDPLEHRVLAPDIAEARLDVVREVGLDATA